MIPFSGPNYSKNSDRCGGSDTACAHCGRPVVEANYWSHVVRVLDGGARYATAEEYALPNGIDGGDMGCFPVGPDCAKRLRKAGVFVCEGSR